MRRTGKKLLALCLTALLILGLLPTTALAVGIREARANESRAIKSGYIPVDLAGGRAISDAYERGDMETVNKLSPHKTRAALPSSYDSRNYGYITSVKNQNPYGTCWAFGTMAPIEAYMIKHGIINNDTGAAATTSMDLSEYHLAWFNYTNAYDKLGMLTGDVSKPVGSTFLDMGGNGAMATFTLMRWAGPASEATSALKYSNASTSGLNSQYAYNYNVAHVTDATWIPVSNMQAVKEGIMEYGAATISYYHSDSYLNSSTGAYCFKQTAAYGSNNYQYGNHAVTVVGWDDNYSKSNFKSSYGPSSNGAWIIKNSWGSSWGKSGYFYLSYEDTASLNDTCFFYKVANLDNYANCYQYDGTNNLTNYQSMGNNCQIANVFTANGSESLKAVAIAPWDEATTYTLKIYKNPTTGNPSSGTLMTTQNGYFEYSGYFTIPLDNPVALSAGDTFSVVFTLSTPSADPDDGKYVHIPYDATAEISWAKWTHANHGNTSYYKEANGSWTDVPNNGDFRIKAYTDDASYTVTAVSNNTAYGTVSVNGNKITATPKAGYYVSDAQVTSGTATVSINGNVITVNASSDCTVKVIFSVKPQLTVNFKACGASVGSQTAYINDSITLPTTATAVNGYSFVGWTDAQVSETTDKPNYYAPGAEYVVTANTTLYALYARTEDGGEIIYEIVAEPITDWTGKYVITSGKDTGMYVLKGISGNTSYESANAGGTVSFASTGMSLNNGVLSNVDNAYVFEATPAGNGYSLKNLSTNTYMGSYNNYLYSQASFTTNYCVWALEYDTYQICMKVSNAASSNYPYMVKGSNSYFIINSTYTGNKTQLWKQTNASTTYYNTNPSAVTHTHTAAAAVQENVVAATCTAAGSYDEVVYCATCGEEMSRTHKTIAALGHNPGASVQENYVAPTETTDGGYDTVVYCTRCNAELSREHTTLPATGVTTYYTVSFSVPSGVSAPASQTVASGSSITLPTASAPAGYTFLGWVTATVNNSTTLPTVLTGSYKPTANVTLKAIYSYTEGSGAVAYQLVTSTPSNWAGNYVITNGNSTSMYVLKGVTPSSNGAEIENSSNAATYASTGMSLSNNVLSNVGNAYVFTLEAIGSYYTVKSASTGAYMGMTSSSYLAGYTSYNSSYCRWTPAVSTSGAAQLKNYANGSYPYFGFNTSSKYFWSASTNNANVLRLWKQTNTGATTYYTTEIGSSTPTTNYTVSFSVPSGVTAPASQTVAANSYITLPTAAAPAGYTFLGWVTSAVNNATTQPSNILTGSYKVTGNITLRALYSYTSGGSGTGYQLLTSAPSDWAGNYVITNGNSTSMYVLTGVTPSSNGAEIENSSNAATYASTGMSLSNNVLSNVGNAYVFTLEPNGSYYTVKSASTGAYMGMNSSSYLAGYTSYNSSYCRWTPAVNSSGAAQLKNYANGSYPYFGFNTSSKYFWSASTNNANVLRLWKQTTTGSGTTYYTT